jgi:c(7)-type cytochrome triheme protein
MKFSFPAIAAAVVVGITTAVFYGTPERAEAEYADVVINEYSEAAGMRPVVFPHWFHRVRFRCKVCHGDLGFQFKAGGNDINMVKIIDGQYCGACHDGDVAWSIENCELCHSGMPGTETQVHHSTVSQLASKVREAAKAEEEASE